MGNKVRATRKAETTWHTVKKVMDHFANPRNVGELENANGVGEVGNSKCGDIMKMYIRVENGVIADVKFKTFGCGAAIATSSMATEMIKANPGASAWTYQQGGHGGARRTAAGQVHCSVLAEQAIKAAIADYYTRKGIDPTPFVGKLEDHDCHGECPSCGI